MPAQPITPRVGRPVPEDMRTSLSPPVRQGLQGWLASWLAGEFGDDLQRAVLVAAGLDLDIGRPDWAFRDLLQYSNQGDEELLDAVHVTLGVLKSDTRTTRRNPPHEDVDRFLAVGRSAWTATEDGVMHRSSPTAQAAFESAATTPGSSSTELNEAWRTAHTRNGSAGDAWDHAIKAVECVLIPIVVPRKSKPNLGDVIGQLRGQPHLWKLGIRGQNRDHSVEPLVAALTLLWPDPNRHGSPRPEAPATPEEERALVNLAVAIVQWAKDGLIARR